MNGASRALSRLLVPLVAVALPGLLIVSSVRTFNELNRERAAYLRTRVATLAGRLEALPPSVAEDSVVEFLSQDEPALVDVRILSPESADSRDSSLEALWSGQELYRTEAAISGGIQVVRAFVPFHSNAGLRLARIDLDAGAADFLVAHARHNLILSSIGGIVLVALASYAIWTTRRAAQLELRQLELEHLAHLGEMSAVLAHEIRNPLGTIKGFAQLLGEQAGGEERSLVEPILSETRRLENLVGDLLLYGKPPTPSLRWTKWEETLLPLRAHAAQLLQGRETRVMAAEARVEWETDPALLQQALLNLLRNAVEAIGDSRGGEVRVEVRRPDSGGVTVVVLDNGPGIPKEIRERLFRPFHTTKSFGTGLGLAITRSLARALGGDLTLTSAQPAGTEAALHFPLAKPREV